MARVSVITACYNSEKYLHESVESTLGQTFTDLELILVDDGSTDRTPAVIRQYAERDERVIPVTLDRNQGFTKALNAGLKAAQGDWVLVMDSDDVAAPNQLEVLLGYLESNADVILVGSGCILIDELGGPMGRFSYPGEHEVLVGGVMRGETKFPHSGTLFSAEASRRIGGYRPRFKRSQDIDFFLRMSEQGHVASVAEPLVWKRRHWESVSHSGSQTDKVVISMAARVCHYCRVRESLDPAEATDNGWEVFIEWLSERMDAYRLFERRRFRLALRRLRYTLHAEGSDRARELLSAAVALVRRVPTGLLPDLKVQRKNMPEILASEWLRRTDGGVQ